MPRVSGRDAIKKAVKDYGGSGVGFFSLKEDGEKARVRFLHTDDKDLDIYVVHKVEKDGKDVYVECLQSESCPLCTAGSKPSVKAFFILYSYDEEKVLVWDRGPGIIDQILGLIDKYGHLNNRDYEIQRHGKANDTKTSYQLFPEDKGPMKDKKGEIEMPEKPSLIGRFIFELTKEEMEALAEDASLKAEARTGREKAAKRAGPGF